MLFLRARPVSWSCFVMFVLGVGGVAPCAAEWHRVDSPNFVVVGDVSAGALRDISAKFEGFRETLSRVLTDRVTGTAVPTVVLVFSSDRAFTPFKPKYQGKPIELSGLFLGRQDVNYIAIAGDSGDDGLRVVFHEYAHLIISNVGRNIPIWLNEGLAEYYSAYDVRNGGREAMLGRAIAPHLNVLNCTTLLPLDQLLKVSHDSPAHRVQEHQRGVSRPERRGTRPRDGGANAGCRLHHVSRRPEGRYRVWAAEGGHARLRHLAPGHRHRHEGGRRD